MQLFFFNRKSLGKNVVGVFQRKRPGQAAFFGQILGDERNGAKRRLEGVEKIDMKNKAALPARKALSCTTQSAVCHD